MSGINDKTVLIFGSGRSGTTWVQDVLAAANNYGTIFEPLHPDAVKGVNGIANTYLLPGAGSAHTSAFFDRLLDGQMRSLWAQYRVRPDRLFLSPSDLLTRKGTTRSYNNLKRLIAAYSKSRTTRGRPSIIKFIRANLLIEWVIRKYPVNAALVVRHPCAVLSSVSHRAGAEWEEASVRRLFDGYLGQESLVRDRLEDKMGALSKMESFAQIQTAVWCIENAWLIEHANSLPLQLVCYEDLVGDSDGCWTTLTEKLKLEFAPGRDELARPSQQASYRMLNSSFGRDQIERWLPIVSAQQRLDVQTVLDVFGVTIYSANEPFPQKN